MRGELRPVLELADTVGRLDALTVTTALFANFCRDFEGRIVGECSDFHPDMDGLRHNILRAG